jgi:hypothetical protein
MANRHKDGIDGIGGVPDCCAPDLATIARQMCVISSIFYILLALHLHPLFSEAVDIEQSLPRPNGRRIDQHTQMAGEAALVLMQDPITIDQKQLGPKFRSLLFQSLKKDIENGHFSEGQKTGNVGLFPDVENLGLFVKGNIFLDAVDDDGGTGDVGVFF